MDEIGELPLSMQKVFLRVLQERRFRPIGGSVEIQSNFRLVAATNQNLDAMVEIGKFRRDLLYRIRSIAIHVPSLTERRSDIMCLAYNRLEQKCAGAGIPMKECSPEFIMMLQEYDWPGNVRELLSAVDHALATAGNAPILHQVHLPPQIRLLHLNGQLPGNEALPKPFSFSLHNEESLPTIREYRYAMIDAAEKEYLIDLMRRTNGQIKSACKISGLSESRLHALLKQHNTPRFRK